MRPSIPTPIPMNHPVLRHVLCTVVAVMLGIGVSPTVAQEAGATLERVAGPDRVATAVAVSQRFFTAAEEVVIATGDGFADALAGSPMAARRGAPVLLVRGTSLPAVVADEISRLGATRATVLGGPAAVGDAVIRSLEGLGLGVERIAGPERFTTAAAAAAALPAVAGQPVVLALGAHPEPTRAWPDALAAANIARDDLPILLSEPTRLPAATADQISRLAPSQVLVMGGPAAISQEVRDEVSELGPDLVEVAGESRLLTALAAADLALTAPATRQSDRPRAVIFATADAFPDALAAGALLAHLDAVLVLVSSDRLDDDVRDWVEANAGSFDAAFVIGGDVAVSPATFDAIQAALRSSTVQTAGDPSPDPTPGTTSDPSGSTPDPVGGSEVPTGPGAQAPDPADPDPADPVDPTDPDPTDPDPTDPDPIDPDPIDTVLPVIDAPAHAPTVRTRFADSVRFLHEGADAVQTGLDPSAIDDGHQAVVAGRVLDRDGDPLPGVTVTIDGHPEFGRTVTRADGRFDMVVLGGQALVVDFSAEGLIGVERTVEVPWQDYAVVRDVVMLAYDPAVTTIDPTAGGTHTATTRTDDDGQRTARLVFPPGLTAELEFADGTRTPLAQMDVRVTEFTVGPNGPNAMPGELPATSMYTYAAELSVDQAVEAGAAHVRFSAPVALHVDNFIGFDVGFPVPQGYYEPAVHAWLPDTSGLIVGVLTSDGTTATLDLDGDGAADDPLTIGITDQELAAIAAGFSAGDSFMRVLVDHFSTRDLNYATKPLEFEPDDPVEEVDPIKPCEQDSGSTIYCEARGLGETVVLDGHGTALGWQSRQQDGHIDGRTVTIQLTDDLVAPEYIAIQLEWSVAGQVIVDQVERPGQNEFVTFTWDGKDRYGRPVYGDVPVSLRTGYVLDLDYANAHFPLPPLFGVEANGGQTNVFELPSQRLVAVNPRRTWSGTMRGFSPGAIAGWTLPAHHRFEPASSVLFRGDGGVQTPDGTLYPVATLLTGGDDSVGEGIPAEQADTEATDVAVGPRGELYITEGPFHRVRRIDADGTIKTIAGTGTAGFTGDGGSAIDATFNGPQSLALHPDGSIWVVDTDNHAIRRIDADGSITTTAGTGTAGYAGDDGPATSASLDTPLSIAITVDGQVFIADAGNDVVRHIGPDGTIRTYAGGGTKSIADEDCLEADPVCYRGDLLLTFPNSVDVSPDGGLLAIGQPGSTPGSSGEYVEVGRDGVARQISTGAFSEATAAYDVAIGPGTRRYISDTYGMETFDDSGLRAGVAGGGEEDGLEGRRIPSTRVGAVSAVDIAPDGTPVVVNDLPVFADAPHTGEIYVLGGGLDSLTTLPGEEPLAPDTVDGEVVAYAVPDRQGAEIHQFAEDGRHLQTVQATTGVVTRTFGYDGGLRLISQTDRDGNTITIERDGDGAPTAVVGPYGRRTTLTVADGTITQMVDPGGRVRTFTYDDGGLMTSQTDPAGSPSTYTYDDLGLLTRAVAADGQVTTLSETLVRDGTFEGTEVARTVGEADGGDTTTYRIGRDTVGGKTIHTITGATGAVTTTVTRPGGHEVEQELPSGLELTTQYGPHPQLGALVLVETRTESYQGRGTRRTSAETEYSATFADPLNPLTLQTMTAVRTHHDGSTLTRSYDATTRTETITYPTGRLATSITDDLGRTVSRQDGAGLDPTVTTYDLRGRVASATTGPHRATYAYDAFGRLSTITNALGEVTTVEWDDADRRVREISAAGRVRTWGWDGRDHIAEWTSPGGAIHEVVRQAAGLQTSLDPPGTFGATTQQFNDRRQRVGQSFPDGTSATETHVDERYLGRDGPGADTALTYPAGETGGLKRSWDTISWTPDSGQPGIPVSMARESFHTAPGSLTITVDGDDHAIDYTVDDELVSGVELSGQALLEIDHTAVGDVTAWGPWAWARNNPGTTPSSITDGTSTIALAVNGGRYLMGSDVVHDTAGDVAGVSVVRDAASRVVSKTTTIEGTSTTERYAYDADGQLTTVSDGAGTVLASYTYDDAGNRTAVDAGGTSAAATYDTANRLLTLDGVAWPTDPHGRVTAIGDALQLTHLPTGELVEVRDGTDAVLATYGYDPMGRRVVRDDASGRTVYLHANPYRDAHVTATVFTPAGGGADVVTEYIHEPGSGLLVALRQDGAWYSVVTDQIGTPVAVVDAAGDVVLSRDHGPFGELRGQTGSFALPVGWGGGMADPITGFVRFGVRDYSPEAGRWVAPDPLGFESGDHNLYRYVLNNPQTLKDPSGLGAAAGQVCVGIHCAEAELACDDSGCSVCFGVGLGTPGAGMGVDPNQGARGEEGYAKVGCGIGPFSIEFDCRLTICGDDNGDRYLEIECDLPPWPPFNPLTTAMFEKWELGCSFTTGLCTPI